MKRLLHLNWLGLVVVCLAGLVAGAGAFGQVASHDASGAANESAVETIALGRAVVPLYGPWKFSVGDSPVDPVTKQMVWAEPGFDDSHWETVDLRPKDGSLDPASGTHQYVPGWTAKGHPGYWGFAWYRIRVKTPGAGQLALTGPDDVDDGFEAFSDGRLIGSFGNFQKAQPTVYESQPTLFAVPAGTSPGEATRVIAFRVWMQPWTASMTPSAGGLHTAPMIGKAGAMTGAYELQWVTKLRSLWRVPMYGSIIFLLGVLAVTLLVFDRSDQVYYWIAGISVIGVVETIVAMLSGATETISLGASLTAVSICSCVLMACSVMVWWTWFRLKQPRWVPRTVVVLTVLRLAGTLISSEILFTRLPHPLAEGFRLLSVVARLGFLILLILVAVFGLRKLGREVWIVLPAFVLLGVSQFSSVLSASHVRLLWFPFGVPVNLSDITTVFMFFTISFLLLRRVSASLKLQREQALDIQQAVEVQRVIVPETHAEYPGLQVETVFRAARQVGGDFFQMVPNEADGSLLVVAGDVTGKGLQAGMQVALLVGAIRATAEMNADPLFVLEALNRRLVGRGSAQATCLAFSVAADGAVKLANAGHIPPYLNGVPVAMEGALPLGMIAEAEFSVMRFALEPGDRLVVISDGIVEATDGEGKLFGFERVAAMMARGIGLEALADAAEAFGQEDDISLVAVSRA